MLQFPSCVPRFPGHWSTNILAGMYGSAISSTHTDHQGMQNAESGAGDLEEGLGDYSVAGFL